MAERQNSVRVLIVMLSGMIVWALHFLFIYLFTSMACARGFADAQVLGMDAAPLCIGAATVIAAVAAAMLGYWARPYKPPGDGWGDDATVRNLRYITAAVAALAIVGILWQGLTFLFLPSCP